MIRYLITFAFAASVAGPPASAVEQIVKPRILVGPEIIDAFQQQTLIGNYADATPFTETYRTDNLTDYADMARSETGSWSVVNNLFCTFYASPEMNGACFRVEQISANCYDFYAAADSTDEARKSGKKLRYTARAHVTSRPDTCPEALSS